MHMLSSCCFRSINLSSVSDSQFIDNSIFLSLSSMLKKKIKSQLSLSKGVNDASVRKLESVRSILLKQLERGK